MQVKPTFKDPGEISYFVDFSVQEIPSIVYIAYETGGKIYTNSKLTFDTLQRYHPDLPAKYLKTKNKIKQDMINTGVKVIIYPDYHIRFFKDLPGIKHVQVFHGTSDKRYDFMPDIINYDLFFIPGQEAYKRYEKKGLLKKGTGILIGYPKLDRVFQGKLTRNEELNKLGLNLRNKTVLYAPTWNDKALNSSWKKFHAVFIHGLPETINLIVKLHPNLMKYRANEVKEFSSKLARYNHAKLLESSADIVPAMAASDLLVGDVSAVTREYLAFKRPFVFLSNKPKWMWNKRKIILWECGEIVTKPDIMWQAIVRTLENPDRYLGEINKRFNNTFYKPDGNAAKRAADAIQNLIN